MKRALGSILLGSMLVLGTGSAFGANIDEKNNKKRKEENEKREVKKVKSITIPWEEYRDKIKTEKEARFAQRAKEKGMTIDELKVKIAEKKRKVQQMNLSVREYKAKKAEREARILKETNEKSITVADLKAKIAENQQKAEKMGLSWQEYRARIRAEREVENKKSKIKFEEKADEEEKSVTIEDLKARLAEKKEKAKKRGLSLREYNNQLKAEKKYLDR